MTGTPGEELTPVSTVELRVRTEEPGVHGVWFNRGVYASQAYAERFKNLHPRDVPNREAWRWLSRGLEEALLAFIGTADGDRGQLRAALYEFEYLPVLTAFRVAADTGGTSDSSCSTTRTTVRRWPPPASTTWSCPGGPEPRSRTTSSWS